MAVLALPGLDLMREAHSCCAENEFPVVYDVPTEQQMSVASTRNIQVSTPCNSGFHGNQRLCFAEQEYELFVSAESADHNLYIWSLPTDRQVGDQVIDPRRVERTQRSSFHRLLQPLE